MMPFMGANKKIELKAEMGKSIITNRNDLVIKVTMTNSMNKQLLIHKYVDFLYDFDSDAEFYFEVEKYQNNNYSKVDGCANYQTVPRFDSLGNVLDYVLDTLPVGASTTHEYNITRLFCITKGKYRTRLVYNILPINKIKQKVVWSNWLYFDVIPDYINPY